MSIDTAAITDSMNNFIQLAIGYIPLGVFIVGTPTMIIIALKFAEKIANLIGDNFR